MATPILKWVGGKTKLLPQLVPLLPKPEEIHHYAEPFVGGGAMLFHIARSWDDGLQKLYRSNINDANANLVHFYRGVADRPYDIADLACRLASAHTRETYEDARYAFNRLRALFEQRSIATNHVLRSTFAALFLYLNKCGYNGLYRVNDDGNFNVAANPSAKWKPKLEELGQELQAAKSVLALASIECLPFDQFIDDQVKHSISVIDPSNVLFFVDPPYLNDEQDGFTKYDKNRWSTTHLMTLEMCMRQVDESGARFMLTHTDTELARDLFDRPRYNITEVSTTQMIAANNLGRGMRHELVIRNYT